MLKKSFAAFLVFGLILWFSTSCIAKPVIIRVEDRDTASGISGVSIKIQEVITGVTGVTETITLAELITSFGGYTRIPADIYHLTRQARPAGASHKLIAEKSGYYKITKDLPFSSDDWYDDYISNLGLTYDTAVIKIIPVGRMRMLTPR